MLLLHKEKKIVSKIGILYAYFIFQAGYVTGDRVWRFPLFSHYTKDVTGAPLADLNNVGKSRKAGACTAAAFLKV